nr:MAG TPA: hypothetical protein [Bacteriophage sp.]
MLSEQYHIGDGIKLGIGNAKIVRGQVMLLWIVIIIATHISISTQDFVGVVAHGWRRKKNEINQQKIHRLAWRV